MATDDRWLLDAASGLARMARAAGGGRRHRRRARAARAGAALPASARWRRARRQFRWRNRRRLPSGNVRALAGRRSGFARRVVQRRRTRSVLDRRSARAVLGRGDAHVARGHRVRAGARPGGRHRQQQRGPRAPIRSSAPGGWRWSWNRALRPRVRDSTWARDRASLLHTSATLRSSSTPADLLSGSLLDAVDRRQPGCRRAAQSRHGTDRFVAARRAGAPRHRSTAKTQSHAGCRGCRARDASKAGATEHSARCRRAQDVRTRRPGRRLNSSSSGRDDHGHPFAKQPCAADRDTPRNNAAELWVAPSLSAIFSSRCRRRAARRAARTALWRLLSVTMTTSSDRATSARSGTDDDAGPAMTPV